MNDKQIKCINLMINTNKTQKQIAKEIEVSEKTICEWKKQKEFKEEIDKNIKENFSSLAVKDILDRAGYKPTEKIKNEVEPSKKFADICKQLGGEGLNE